MRIYLYQVGDIVNGLKIIEQSEKKDKHNYSTKSYLCRCIVDGYESNISEYTLKKGHGCAVCSGIKIKKGTNDIATVRPDLVDYFVHIEDAHTNGRASGKRVLMKCPDCGNTKNHAIKNLVSNGLACKCGNGNSYPSRFVESILAQNNLNYTREHSSVWSKNKKYDFFIEEYNAIIEVHGGQHYFQTSRGRSLEQEIENDKLKKAIAKENGIKNYIVIDCRKSDMEWIKNSVLNSELMKIIEKIDWEKCHKDALGSEAKKICTLWEKDELSIKEIMEITKFSDTTIRKYLKIGNEIGWCKYTPLCRVKSDKSKKIHFNGLIYDSITELSRDTNIVHATLSRYLSNKRKTPKELECLGLRYATLEDIKKYPLFKGDVQ